MSLIHELEKLQAERGFLGKDTLRDLSHRLGVPLYRLQELVSFYPHFRTEPAAPITMAVCRDVSCHLNGCDGLAERIRASLGAADDVRVEEVSCLGCCELAPAVRVNGVAVRVDEPAALAAAARAGRVVPRSHQTRRWTCDPYADGEPGGEYEAFRRLLAQDDAKAIEALIATLKESGLKGMGGAGFPTGLKWEIVRGQSASPKYVICNADESEPGTFVDRVIMEEMPHLVIEGMMLAGHAIGASRGIIYLRHEYEQARVSLERTLGAAREVGWLGEGILGSDFAFDIEIFLSPGGYILGEETALLEALEDRRGEPRNKPPFPGERGLWGKPTLINNVETLAYAAAIALRGADWWRSLGRNGHGGLKLMAVSGHVERPGVYEIPTGTTIAELIQLAGGVSGGRSLKAFAPGGASSNFLPADRADTPIDFESLAAAGSMLGSGALVVVAEGKEMLPLAANIVRFFRNESCGKCVPCRDGTQKAVQMLDGALDAGAPIEWSTIEKLGFLLSETSICGLGYVALNPLVSIREHWPGEVPTT